MNPMHYLFAAYLAIWIILACYLFSIHSREKKLREEVRRLSQILEKIPRCLKLTINHRTAAIKPIVLEESIRMGRGFSPVRKRDPVKFGLKRELSELESFAAHSM